MAGECLTAGTQGAPEATQVMTAAEAYARAQATVAQLALVEFIPDGAGGWSQNTIRESTYVF